MYNVITVRTDGQKFECYLDGKIQFDIKNFDQAQNLAWEKGQQAITINDYVTGIITSVPAARLEKKIKTKLKVQDLTEMNEKMVDKGWMDGYCGASKRTSNALYNKGFNSGKACRKKDMKSNEI